MQSSYSRLKDEPKRPQRVDNDRGGTPPGQPLRL